MKCKAITSKNTQCKFNSTNNGFCGRHSKKSVLSGETYTITFGDQAENHVGMNKIGKLAPEGFNFSDLENAKKWFLEKGVYTEIHDLSEHVRKDNHLVDDAYILVAKNGLAAICDVKSFFLEQEKLEKDKKAFMYGKVLNKNARHNLCFDDDSVEPNYEIGQGRIVAFRDTPILNSVREILPEIIGNKANLLKAEGNYYYDISKCGIGFHGDSERRLVIGIRVGSSFPLRYHWFLNGEPFGPNIDFQFDNGDIYIMSNKAVGTDWKRKNIPTLRHSAGCDKYINL